MHFLLPLSELLIVIRPDCLGKLSFAQNGNIYARGGAKAEHFSILASTSMKSALHCAHYKRQFPPRNTHLHSRYHPRFRSPPGAVSGVQDNEKNFSAGQKVARCLLEKLLPWLS